MNEQKFKKIIKIAGICMLIGALIIVSVQFTSIKEALLNNKSNKINEEIAKLEDDTNKINQEINDLKNKVQENIVEGDKTIIEQENVEAIYNNPLPIILFLSSPADNFIYEFDKIVDIGQDDRLTISGQSDFNQFSFREDTSIKVFSGIIEEKPIVYFEFKGKIYIYKLGDQSLLNKNDINDYIKTEDEKYRAENGIRK